MEKKCLFPTFAISQLTKLSEKRYCKCGSSVHAWIINLEIAVSLDWK